MLASLTTPGSFVKITQDKPYTQITGISSWIEDASGSGEVKREFRWGETNRERSSWVPLTEENLQKILIDPSSNVFVDFRYTHLGGGPFILNSLDLNYQFPPNGYDPFLGVKPALTVAELGNLTNLMKIENFTFNPYAVHAATVLQKELTYTINQLFGIEVLYARAVPLTNGKDVTLHEWTLYDVDDPKCIRVLVPDNEFPDTKLLFNSMGLDFEMPFEVHIDKNYYESIFGVGTGPQRRDIVYFPLTNRIYEIESSYLFKDFMMQPTYYKVALKKYAPKANRYESTDLRNAFDNITYDSVERFGEDVELQAEKTTNPKQFSTKIASRNYDPVRLTVHDNLLITENKLLNFTNVLSESQYDLRSLYNVTASEQEKAIVYRETVNFSDSEDRSFSIWFKELKPNYTTYKDTVKGYLSLGTPGATTTPISFTISAKRNYAVDSVLKITRFNGLTLYGKITNITTLPSGYLYTMDVDNRIIAYLNIHFTNWSSASISTGYILEPAYEQVIINGFENSKGWKISIYASRYIIFTDDSQTYMSILNRDLTQDYWYGLFVNMSNFYKQLTFDLWIRKWSETAVNPPATTDLENIYTYTFTDFEKKDRSNEINYFLPASQLVMTNIRLYDKLETDIAKQVIMLNQTIVQDSQFSIIIDNSLPRLNLPWIGQTK